VSESGDPATVLVVEDDPSLRTALVTTLKAAGLRPVPARDATEGKRWFAHYAPDVVLLDLGLPDEDGLKVIEAVRAKGATPIVVLSARNAEAVKVAALDRGADDYVTKPFGVDELLARIRAALRHGVQARGSQPVVRTSDLEIDMGLRRVTKAGEVIRLSPKEYDLLVELALQLGRPVAHGDLLRAVWGSEAADIQYLRVYVGQLRQKLERDPAAPTLLISEPAIGYRLAQLP
jgi:two-component system KDP operon response regulator KdpE